MKLSFKYTNNLVNYLIKIERWFIFIMDNKNIIGNEIVFDYYNEISIGELIYEIDNSKQILLYKIGDNNNLEKNILIQIKKEKN